MIELFKYNPICNELKCNGHSCHFPYYWLEPIPLYRVKYIYYLMTNLLPIDKMTLVIFDKHSFVIHIELVDLEEYY